MAFAHSHPVELPLAARQVIAKLAAEHKATVKQTKFAELVVSGLTLTDAYRASYDSANPNPWRQASRAGSNDVVSTLIQEGRAYANHLRASRRDEWREAIDQVTWEIMHDEEAKRADRLTAAKLGGSQVHVQAFAQAQAADPNAIETLHELITLFQSELCESGITIDITPQLTAPSQQRMQAVDYIEMRPMFELDECAGGGCD